MGRGHHRYPQCQLKVGGPSPLCCQPACSCWDPLVITRGRRHKLLYKGFEMSRNYINPMEIKFLP